METSRVRYLNVSSESWSHDKDVKAKSVFSVFLCSEAVYVVLHVYFCNHLSVIDFGLTHGFKHVICQSQYHNSFKLSD